MKRIRFHIQRCKYFIFIPLYDKKIYIFLKIKIIKEVMFLRYLEIAIELVGITLLFSVLVLTLMNKFDNRLIKSTLSDNIVSLIYSNRYTEATFKSIKFILILRVIVYTLGLIIIVHGSFSPAIEGFIILFLIGLKALGNSFIERQLERDYSNCSEEEKV